MKRIKQTIERQKDSVVRTICNEDDVAGEQG